MMVACSDELSENDQRASQLGGGLARKALRVQEILPSITQR